MERMRKKGGREMELIEDLFVSENVTDLETVVYSLRRDNA